MKIPEYRLILGYWYTLDKIRFDYTADVKSHNSASFNMSWPYQRLNKLEYSFMVILRDELYYEWKNK